MTSSTSEDVLLEMPSIKHKKDDGRLYLMSERLAWIQGNRDVVTLSHKYADIKSQKISPEGKPKIQLQVVLHDNSTYTFHFVNPDGPAAQYRDRDQVKELLLQLLPKFKRKVNQELEEKNKLLSENPKLLRLYKDLVIDGIISTEEFWMTHAQQFLLSSQKTIPKQETGVSSGFLSGIHPETDGANGLRYNLTTDVIESIFKTYPAVRRKHLESVPSQMAESVFWTKFFQSHYFHRDRLPVLKDLFSDCAKADDKEMRRELDRVRIVHRDLMGVLLDSESVTSEGMLKDTEVISSNSGGSSSKAEKETVTPQGILKNMIKRFNHHSIMVLKACDRAENQSGSSVSNNNSEANGGENSSNSAATATTTEESNGNLTKKKKKKRDREKEKEIEEQINNGLIDFTLPPEIKRAKLAEKLHLEDLQDNSNSGFTTKLSLTKVDRYLNGPIPDFKTDQASVEQIQQTALLMREYNEKWKGKPRLLDSVTAVRILGDLRPGGALMIRNSRGGNAESSTQLLHPEIDLELRSMYTSLGELLRHFWSCFPPTTPALEEKAQKTHETLKKFEQIKMSQLKERLLRDHLSADVFLAHSTSMINAAYGKFSQWVQRNVSQQQHQRR